MSEQMQKRRKRTRTAVPTQDPTVEPALESVALAEALEKNHDVKTKVETCAVDLNAVNDAVKRKIDAGATAVPAREMLADSEKVEKKVQECVDELHQVNETLAVGVDELTRMKIALADSRKALADSEFALACAQDGEKKAELRAMHDSTTGLPNRDLFDDRLTHAISIAQRHDWTLAVMFLDLDRFKSINDTRGHAAGDRVLKAVASRLLLHARSEDTVCRNGGDEFLYLLMNPQGRQNLGRIARALRDIIAQPINTGDHQLSIQSSVGIATYPVDGTTGDALIRNADIAMYRAKKSASGCEFYDPVVGQAPE